MIELTRRSFIAAVPAVAAVPPVAHAVQPVDPKARIAAAVRELEEAMAEFMVGKPGYWHAAFIQKRNNRIVNIVARFHGDELEYILDEFGNPTQT